MIEPGQAAFARQRIVLLHKPVDHLVWQTVNLKNDDPFCLRLECDCEQ
jgi:hypothetical protein